jgi:hypothetical protein
MSDSSASPSAPVPPSPLMREWVRLLLGFGIGVALGLAPYLGKVHVPGFDALLTLIPESVQRVALPLSAALMGIVAVWIQWSAGDRPSASWLRKSFRKTLLLALLGLCLFSLVQTFVVVRIFVPSEDRVASFVVGFTRLPSSPCPPEMPDAVCIRRITFDEAMHAAVWGDRQLRLAGLSLLGTYLLTTGSFGVLVGLLLVRTRQRAQARALRHRRRA